MLDSLSLPDSPEALARWLTRHEAAVAAKVVAALQQIVHGAWDAWVNTLTAAAPDLSAFDGIPQAWLTFITDELIDDLGELYLAGNMTAWVGLPFTPSVEFAEQWQAVVNDNAVSFLRDATNRLAGVGDTTWKMLRAQVSHAVQNGVDRETLKGKIEDLTGWSEARADTIARTEANGAYVRGDLAGARALGQQGPVEKVWVATRDARTRLSHANAHDQVQPFGSQFSVGGVSMDAPHDPSAPAGEVVNCRCYVEFLYAGDARPDGSTVEPKPVAGHVSADNEPATLSLA